MGLREKDRRQIRQRGKKFQDKEKRPKQNGNINGRGDHRPGGGEQDLLDYDKRQRTVKKTKSRDTTAQVAYVEQTG